MPMTNQELTSFVSTIGVKGARNYCRFKLYKWFEEFLFSDSSLEHPLISEKKDQNL